MDEYHAFITAVLKQVAAFFAERGQPCALVGGFVRDQLLGRQGSTNIDLAIPCHALGWGRELAQALAGSFVVLDAQEGSVRIVLKSPTAAMGIELDLNDYRAATLEGDLGLRDFTINALALNLEDWLTDPDVLKRRLIDPLCGRDDLQQGRIRLCHAGTLLADPLRILRAYRLAVQLGFEFDAAVVPAIQHALQRLSAVSAERIRDELFRMLETAAAARAVKAMSDDGVLAILFPEVERCRAVDQGDFHHLDVLEHQIEAVRQGDRLLSDLSGFEAPLRAKLIAYTQQQLVPGRSVKALIKLAALLHDIGKPYHREDRGEGNVWFIGHEVTGADLAEPLVKRLALSSREEQWLVNLVRHHLRPGFLSRMPELSRRAVYRFYRDLGEAGPACALEWWCDRNATRGKTSRVDDRQAQWRFVCLLLESYFFQAETVVRPPRLIDGTELMQYLALKPGPVIGRILQGLEEAQAEGSVQTKEQALQLARRLLQQSSSPR
jgi:putative nucleotidyltransferase with HDIG domain